MFFCLPYPLCIPKALSRRHGPQLNAHKTLSMAEYPKIGWNIARKIRVPPHPNPNHFTRACQSRHAGVYGPPVGQTAIIFVDDLNMPEVETYGAQPPLELLRQMIDNGGW